MRTQPTFWGFATSTGRQAELWDTDGPELSTLSCGECGEPLERTPSGYLCCPRGHGRLIFEAIDDDASDLFDSEQ